MKWYVRVFYACVFAIPLMMVTYAFGQAAFQAKSPEIQSGGESNCAECHEAFQVAWENGAHGHATNDPVFQEAWQEQGQPPECLACHVTGYDEETGTWAAEGITCEACHSPITAQHPLAPMSVDQASKFCGNCHQETYFEWQASKHREVGVECIACHDPHATGLKNENPGLLCATCHRGRASNFAHSAHSQEGLTCIDCHIGHLVQELGGGHSKRDHSFFVSLSACNSCHVYQMHDPIAVHPEQSTPTPPDAMVAVDTIAVSAEPIPVSPLGFTTLAGLIGVALGVILAPWLERWQQEMRRRDG